MTDKLGIAIVAALLSGFAWVPVAMSYCKYQNTTKIRQEALIEAAKRVDQDMKEACHCWYTDSRCKAPETTIVVCSMPAFMRRGY